MSPYAEETQMPPEIPAVKNPELPASIPISYETTGYKTRSGRVVRPPAYLKGANFFLEMI